MHFSSLSVILFISALSLTEQCENVPTTVRKLIHPVRYESGLPYTPAVLVDKTLYLAGQIGWDVHGNFPEDIGNETRQALENMGDVLAKAGATYSNVVKMVIMLEDMNDFDAMNEVYIQFFTKDLPARTAFEVTKLPVGARIEFDAIAIVGEILTSNR